MAAHKLTDKFVRTVTTPRKYADGGGLFPQVAPSKAGVTLLEQIDTTFAPYRCAHCTALSSAFRSHRSNSPHIDASKTQCFRRRWVRHNRTPRGEAAARSPNACFQTARCLLQLTRARPARREQR